MKRWFWTLGVVAALGLTGTAAAEPPKVGDPAPDFEMTGSDGKTYKLSDLQGKTVVIAWYPRAFTPG